MPSLETLAHQFRLADEALHQAEHLARAGYWSASISHSYQVALRSAAGLLYGLRIRPTTEKEVRIAFASAFISRGQSDPRFDRAFRTLETLRQKADFDIAYAATREEAEQALALAREFRQEALRLQKEALP